MPSGYGLTMIFLWHRRHRLPELPVAAVNRYFLLPAWGVWQLTQVIAMPGRDGSGLPDVG